MTPHGWAVGQLWVFSLARLSARTGGASYRFIGGEHKESPGAPLTATSPMAYTGLTQETSVPNCEH